MKLFDRIKRLLIEPAQVSILILEDLVFAEYNWKTHEFDIYRYDHVIHMGAAVDPIFSVAGLGETKALMANLELAIQKAKYDPFYMGAELKKAQ